VTIFNQFQPLLTVLSIVGFFGLKIVYSPPSEGGGLKCSTTDLIQLGSCFGLVWNSLGQLLHSNMLLCLTCICSLFYISSWVDLNQLRTVFFSLTNICVNFSQLGSTVSFRFIMVNERQPRSFFLLPITEVNLTSVSNYIRFGSVYVM
jgi:hypothetical protein